MSEETRPRFSPSAELQARLELQWKRTARRLSDTLTCRLRTELELRFRAQQFRSFDQFVRELEVPTGSLRFQCEPDGLAFLLEPGPRLLFPMLDRLLGGRHTMSVQRRPLTELDRRVALQLSETIADAVTATWTEPKLEKVRPLGVECDPQRIRIFPPEESVVVVCFDAQFESIQTTVRLCLPMNAILTPPATHLATETAEAHGEMVNVPNRAAESQTESQIDPAQNSATQRSASTGSASSGSASTGSASTGSASTGSASTGSASTGSASTGSASTGSASSDSARGAWRSPSRESNERATSVPSTPASTMVELALSLPPISYEGPLTVGTILPIPVREHEALFHVTLDGVTVFDATPIATKKEEEYRIRIERPTGATSPTAW